MSNADRFNQLFSYDQSTGILTWKLPTARNIKKGQAVGSFDKHGYRKITVDGKTLLAHRVIWCMHYGAMPNGDVDHINRNRLDNRIENLRLTTRSMNAVNSTHSRSSTGFRGITRMADGSFRAQIGGKGKVKHLGFFKTAEDAKEFYELASVLKYGEFSPYHPTSAAQAAKQGEV